MSTSSAPKIPQTPSSGAPSNSALSRGALLIGALLAGALTPQSARAAEWTDVIDAADGDDPFDITAEVFYRRHLRRAKITREYNCDRLTRPEDQSTCASAPEGGQVVNVKELRYQRWTHEMVPRLHVGLWKDLELLLEAPIVMQDQQEVRYAGNGGDSSSPIITAANSSIAPDSGQQLFGVPPSGLPTRAGFGDMLFKLRFAPVSNERDSSRGEWVVEAGYRAPTGTPMKFGNVGVGRGVHELELATSFSRRYRYIEPYSSFTVNIPFASSAKSPFQQYVGSQEYVTPGLRARFDFGAEMIPYYNQRTGMKFFINLGLGAAYQGEGRDYSELFDALAIGGNACAANPNDITGNRDAKNNCAFYNPEARFGNPSPQAPRAFDGITTVEQFVTVRGNIGFGVYVSKYVKFGANAALAHETEHNLTNSEIGRDIYRSTPAEVGVLTPATTIDQASEHNPTFTPSIDTIGRRIRIEETTVFSASFNFAVMF